MLVRPSLALVSICIGACWGQSPAGETCPAEAEQALRARVTQYLQYHVDGDFRKAYELVADDTKDEYFKVGKIQLKAFEIQSVSFREKCTRADVAIIMTMPMNVRMQQNISVVPSTITWKVEKGDWFWYHKLQDGDWLTPMGPSKVDPKTPKIPDGVGHIPDKIDAGAVQSAAAAILKQSSIDKNFVNLATDQASSDKVVFHNGVHGSVRLVLGVPEVPGLSAKLDKTEVPGGQDAVLEVKYVPGDSAPKAPVTLQLLTEPFDQLFVVTVNLGIRVE